MLCWHQGVDLITTQEPCCVLRLSALPANSVSVSDSRSLTDVNAKAFNKGGLHTSISSYQALAARTRRSGLTTLSTPPAAPLATHHPPPFPSAGSLTCCCYAMKRSMTRFCTGPAAGSSKVRALV